MIITTIPSMRKIFAIFDQIILPSTRSFASDKLHTIFTTNSGVEVPNATMVSPITRSEILNLFARDEAPSTSQSAHFIKMVMPRITRNEERNIIFC